MEFGFSVSGTPWEAEFRLYPTRGGGSARLITVARFRGHVAALLGHLYYRDERIAELDGRLPRDFAAECQTNDAALALALYAEGGSPSLARLEGDFAVVVWDAEANCFVARRDPFGGYPLFWTRVGETVAIATGLARLLALLPSRTVSLDHLADFLVRPSSGAERAAEACAYERINRVLPDTIVRIDIDTGRIVRERCWDWLKEAVDPGIDRLEEIAAGYRDRLDRAVRERVRGRSAAHLSGGMDSTSVCLLALDLVRSGMGEAPLHALSLVYERLPSLALERRYIDEVLAGNGEGLVGHAVLADALLDFDNVPDPPFHDEPFVGLSCLQTERALCARAAQLGVETVLTGRGADELLDMLPYHLTDWLRRWRFYAAWQEACAWAEARGSNPWRVLRQFGIGNLFPNWRKGSLGKLLQHRAGLAAINEWSIPPWVRPEFAGRHALAERAAANARQMYRGAGETRVSLAVYGLKRRVGEAYRWLAAAPHGIALCHPFLDPRVLRFGLGIQARLTPRPEPVKPVLAEAMRGVLPESIRTRRDKRSFNEVYYLGLRRNLPALRAMVVRAPIDELGSIDKAVLLESLEEAALGTTDPYRLQRLDVTMCLISWLSRQLAWQAQPSPPGEVIRSRPVGAARISVPDK